MTADEPVLVIFPSYCSDTRRSKIVPVIRKRLELKNISIGRITYEKACIIIEVDNPVEAMSSISEIYGIDMVAVARKVRSQFQAIIDCIVRVGKQIVVPDCSFFVKVLVENSAKVGFASKDVQFIASGNLMTEAANHRNRLKIARDEKRADHKIICYVGRNMSYVFIHSETGLGGLPFNYQHCKVLSTIHSVVSAASCLASLKCGLVPDICLLYHDAAELKDNAKLLGVVANRTNLKRLNIKVGHICTDIRDRSGEIFLLNEALAISLLSLLPGRYIILPLNMYVHPFSFIEHTVQRMREVDKIALMPLLFLGEELINIISNLGGSQEKAQIDRFGLNITIDVEDCRKYYNRVGKLSQLLIDNLQSISFKIGPNYIHDIIDAI